MFSQVRVHQGRAEGGLGIGLSLVRRLVEMHDGTVSAQSEGSGKGSTFIVRLPLVSAGARSAEPTSTAIQPSVAPRRILIVDDNQDAADSLTVLLQYQGHEVVTAYNGEEGLKCARTLRPHLVFLDLGMPRMDGIEAAQQLRSLPGGERMMLIALTGWGQEQDQQRTRMAGFDRHLLKPIDLGKLNEILMASPG
ncbi:MAG TPA: response regulator [Steroidobacteraceae bacterium]